MPQIHPPGDLTDLNDSAKGEWSELISSWFDENIQKFNLTQFFNPTREKSLGTDADEKKIDWFAFPKTVINTNPGDTARWKKADLNRLTDQDEYCEWHVERNNDGKIVRVTFTSEGPEYWGFMAEHSPNTLVALYRDLIDSKVVLDDLLDENGEYDPRNRWNDPSQGGKIAHLAHPDNTLGAFVNIGAQATIIRRRADGTIITSETELIDCGGYGGRDRHSDPHIGGEVNTLARMHARITMANPVGLSMDGLFPVGWKTPDGSDPKEYWKIVRGSEAHQLRTVYEVPPGKDFVVGDIEINHQPINFGGQIADFIRVKLIGLAHQFGQHKAPPRDCPPPNAMVAALASSAPPVSPARRMRV